MKQYWETLKTYLASANENTKVSEINEAWNTAVAGYNADEDVLEAIEAYKEAKKALATLFKSLVKLEYEAEELCTEAQIKSDYAIKDVCVNRIPIVRFADGEDVARDRRGERTFDQARNFLVCYVWENQEDGGCPKLDPANF